MSDISLAALEQQAAMGGSIGADIAATAGLGPLVSIGGPLTLFASILHDMLKDGGLQETPMTPEERAAFEAQQRLALAGSQLAQGGEGAKEMVLDAIGQAVLDGVNQSEIDYVTDLINRGVVTAEEVSLSTGIPEQEIQSVYEQQRREPSVLELLQTGPVQPLDVEGGIGDVAGTEVVDLSERTTDDLITIDDLMADTTASTVDGGDLIENPWIYIGDGNFRHSQTGETVYNEDAANNPAYVVGGSYSGPESGTQDTDVKVNILGGVPSDIAGTGGVTGDLVGDAVVQTPTGTPGTVKQVGDGGGDGLGDGVGDGAGDGDGVRSGLIMMLSQQAPITEQMFSRELFEPKLKELDNVAKAIGMLQNIARGF